MVSDRGFIIVAVALLMTLGACDRESRDYRRAPTPDNQRLAVSPTDLKAGGGLQAPARDPRAAMYEGNADHLAQGQKYYEWCNCYGCHAAGGGDIGPALMDDEWRYGGSIEQIRASIADGRPNGMPSFAGKIPDQQLWELAAYVRSMSGTADKLAAATRTDHMSAVPPPNQRGPTPERSDAAARLGTAR